MNVKYKNEKMIDNLYSPQPLDEKGLKDKGGFRYKIKVKTKRRFIRKPV